MPDSIPNPNGLLATLSSLPFEARCLPLKPTARRREARPEISPKLLRCPRLITGLNRYSTLIAVIYLSVLLRNIRVDQDLAARFSR